MIKKGDDVRGITIEGRKASGIVVGIFVSTIRINAGGRAVYLKRESVKRLVPA